MNLVVTVPKWFWPEWIGEGDAVGEAPTGTEWGFFMGGSRPPIGSGDRLYIVAHGLVRGYSPVTRRARDQNKWIICRESGAVAVTIEQTIKGFQGFRKVWWRPEDEKPFPDWMTRNIPAEMRVTIEDREHQKQLRNASSMTAGAPCKGMRESG